MAVPKRKTSKAKKRSRRNHKGLKVPPIVFDKASGEFKLSHHITPNGQYKDRKITKDEDSN
ncbi:50S ribosomal protein L32 [Facklamia miroungae]|uniref:Large ribosomal subunit protein bL32 n=1 Tax=Facklamia miroungae TaxID=120956 RepID=A0A1G7NYL2_9LACT|nr:50S ribosomal protein L32 [Facklamia miroungae]NKZ28490.1 50S ribosomal protein L32 [Facklamia miroungae]SDF78290.1 large subunit ribosomal protein L32 [Facklamia miroungae]